MAILAPIEIDGSHGEGGGQLLRTALALSAIAQRPLRMVNIRARRGNPGLAPQHLTAARAVAALCDAEVDGLALKSQEIMFRPGQVRSGHYDFDVGTAGSIALVLQALLPVALASGQPFSFAIRGGTDVRAAPPIDYLDQVLLPLLAKMGASVRLDIRRRGYYPRGGGDVRAEVHPCAQLRPLVLERQGKLEAVNVYAHVANLPPHVVQRMVHSACEILSTPVHVVQKVLVQGQAYGAGGGITLAACCENTVLGASALAEKGVPAEQLGEAAARELQTTLASGATLDRHAADQMLIYLALAKGPSRFWAPALSTHAETAMWLIGRFLPFQARLIPEAQRVGVEIVPGP